MLISHSKYCSAVNRYLTCAGTMLISSNIPLQIMMITIYSCHLAKHAISTCTCGACSLLSNDTEAQAAFLLILYKS